MASQHSRGLRIHSQHGYRAAIRLAVALENLDGGRLAGPIRSEQGDHLAGLDREIEPVDRGDRAVGLVQALDHDGRHRTSLFVHAQRGSLHHCLPAEVLWDSAFPSALNLG